MKTSQFIISTLRDAPNDAVIASHQLMMRTGMLRKLGNGLYSYMPIGYRSFKKLENIIREELDKAGMMEMRATVIQPGEIWKESGRWDKMGAEMLKPQNRAGQDMVVSPTAEESVTAVVREGLSSYKQLPFTLYQINTKYRDEIRPRYGVMRGREFTMMDAYSFDKNQTDLDNSYNNAANAYRKIFKRLGLSTISVKADTGAMGGNGSEEFMVESEVGDDTLILCPNCGYAANVEKATCKPDIALDKNKNPQVAATEKIEEVPCPGVESIEQMEEFFKMPASQFIKVLVYKVYNSGIDFSAAPGGKDFKEGEAFVAVAIRGDLEVSETKLAASLKASGVELANLDDVIKYSGAPHGFVGPVGLTKVPLVADESVMVKKEDGSFEVRVHDTVTGGGKKDVDTKHVEPVRDFVPFMTVDVRTVKPGDKCPDCGGTFYTKKGNELGHIFKLGDKYTKSMNVTYLDENAKSVTPVMGCYGIGVDRTLASIIEAHHDENGVIWPMTVAPFQVVIIPVKYDVAMKDASEKLYEELKSLGIEVLLDDRNERPGVKFKDFDLIGIPLRVVVGEKNLPNVEVKLRKEQDAKLIPAESAANEITKIVQAELAALNGIA